MVKLQKQINDKKSAPSGAKFIIVITVKLLVISMITALLLSCVNALTAERIADNIKREKSAAITEIFPNSDSSEQLEFAFEEMSAVYKVYSNSSVIGYAAEVTPLGFGGEMTVMVGVNTDGTVSGVKLISHSETPGLGSRVGENTYLIKYSGKNASQLNEVDAITGSTVSSEAIREGISNALSVYTTLIPGNAGGGAK